MLGHRARKTQTVFRDARIFGLATRLGGEGSTRSVMSEPTFGRQRFVAWSKRALFSFSPVQYLFLRRTSSVLTTAISLHAVPRYASEKRCIDPWPAGNLGQQQWWTLSQCFSIRSFFFPHTNCPHPYSKRNLEECTSRMVIHPPDLTASTTVTPGHTDQTRRLHNFPACRHVLAPQMCPRLSTLEPSHERKRSTGTDFRSRLPEKKPFIRNLSVPQQLINYRTVTPEKSQDVTVVRSTRPSHQSKHFH